APGPTPARARSATPCDRCGACTARRPCSRVGAVDAYEIAEVEAGRVAAGRLYQEFLRVPAISAGLYVLEAGADDPQGPHQQDEIYYTLPRGGQIHGDTEGRADAGADV